VSEISNSFTIHNVLDVSPQKKSIGLNSELLGSQNIGLHFQIQVLGESSFKDLRIDWQKGGAAPTIN
jgi:hypothetical protein